MRKAEYRIANIHVIKYKNFLTFMNINIPTLFSGNYNQQKNQKKSIKISYEFLH